MQNKSKIWEKILQERINRYTKSTSLRNRYQADSKNKGIVKGKLLFENKDFEESKFFFEKETWNVKV